MWARRRQARWRGPDPPLTLPTAGPSLHPEPGAGTRGDLVSEPQLNSLNSRPSTGGRDKPECGSQPGLTKSKDNLSGREVSPGGEGRLASPGSAAHLLWEPVSVSALPSPPGWVLRSRHTGCEGCAHDRMSRLPEAVTT